MIKPAEPHIIDQCNNTDNSGFLRALQKLQNADGYCKNCGWTHGLNDCPYNPNNDDQQPT